MSKIITSILSQHFRKKKKQFSSLSTAWMAQKLAVSQAYVSQILSGKRALPIKLIDPICDLLDIDAEKKEVITSQLLMNQGWTNVPTENFRKAKIDLKSHGLNWINAPIKDFPVLLFQDALLVLEATDLKSFDGTDTYLSEVLEIPLHRVKSILDTLEEHGYISQKNGKLSKVDHLLEFQSKLEKTEIAKYHSCVMEKAIQVMNEKTSEVDLNKRFISSSVFTCSRNHIPVLRAKMSEFLKEITAESAEQTAEEVYSFSLILIPQTKLSDLIR